MSAKTLLDMPGGLKMPTVGIGTWQVSNEAELESALNAALEAGYRHIDTASGYNNEEYIGRVLKQWFTSGKLKREDLFITTKLSGRGMHPDTVESSIKKSLENLQLDYVDLYLVHSPIAFAVPEGETNSRNVVVVPTDHIAIWRKMEEQVDAGRAKTIGLSNFNIRQIDRILKEARIKPACLQVELHVYLQQRDLVKFCHDNGIVVVAYSPLGSPGSLELFKSIGQLDKKMPDMLHDPVIQKIAAKHKKSSAQVMLRYLLQKNVAVIPKSVSPKRLKENLNVFDFSLDAKDIKALDDLEVGEEARVCCFRENKAYFEHPEYPYPR